MQLRRRSVGNIRFIGELYKRQMLTSQLMMRIIQGLLKKADEESLECLCKLITTVGQMLDTNAMNSNKSNVKVRYFLFLLIQVKFGFTFNFEINHSFLNEGEGFILSAI